MLLHGIQVDHRPAVGVPEQVVPFEVAMADARLNKLCEQFVQRQQLDLGGITAFDIGREALDDVRPVDKLGDQPGFATQPQETLLLDRQRFGRGNAEKHQAIAFAPRMPGATRAPEALEPVAEILDVVTLDDQRATASLDPADARRATGLVQMPFVEQGISLLKHRQHGRFFVAVNGAKHRCGVLDAEQAAIAHGLAEKILEPPASNLIDLPLQRLHRQTMFAVAQQIMHQQFFREWLKSLGQLSKEYPEVFQHLLPRQRFAGLLGTNARPVNQVQPPVMAQQIVQVQVFLPQAFGVLLSDGGQRLAEHQLLLVGQRRQFLNLGPGIAQT
ncbi:hypothetical protein ALP75_201028 [Pseudomonas syringae pv. actinidiae]|nr:hypothetical protein ALP75_201028 [Pseudomonas syringae pv. actinidiae]